MSPTMNRNVIIGSSKLAPTGEDKKIPFTVEIINEPTSPTKNTCLYRPSLKDLRFVALGPM